MAQYKLTRHATPKHSLPVKHSRHKHASEEEARMLEGKDGEKKQSGRRNDSGDVAFTFKAFSQHL